MTKQKQNHMINPIKDRDMWACLKDLESARSCLTKVGREAFEKVVEMEKSEGWGVCVKRTKVVVPDDAGCGVIKAGSHSLFEVVNQCATLERLLDAIAWVKTDESELSKYTTIVKCHPTTSSAKNDHNGDNDLVITDGKECARFEISDVASSSDGNRKERKDLISLGVITGAKKEETLNISQWPNDRLFLAVSKEFGEGLLARKPLWITRKHCHYRKYVYGDTWIIEVVQGPEL